MEDPEAFRALLAKLDERVELMDWHSASGFVVEHFDHTGFEQLIGPFDKNTPDALTFIDRLRAEIEDTDPENVIPAEFRVRLLFPPDERLMA